MDVPPFHKYWGDMSPYPTEIDAPGYITLTQSQISITE